MKARYIVVGAVAALAAGIIVSCGGGGGGGGGVATYTVGGMLSGASGSVVLKLNGGNDMTATNGSFTFGAMVGSGGTYNVQVVDASDRCTVANGAGTMGVADVTNVAVTCAPQGTQMVVRTAVLNGAQAGTGAAGTGVGGVIVDPTAGAHAITGGITFSGLSGTPNAAHIHRGNGTIAVGLNLATDNATGILLDGLTLSDADYAELLAGTLYFNVHTVANPNGEIRGQINLQGGVISGVAAMDASQEAPTASSSPATGRGTAIVDRATRNILIAYITHNVADASAAHIHSSQGAVSGPVIVGFPHLETNLGGTGQNLASPPAGSQMTAQNVTDFLAAYLYFNVHSTTDKFCPAPTTACTGGEIRGNVTAPIQ